MVKTSLDVVRGVEQRGGGGGLTGAENLLLHFTPFAEDWSKLPVIVSGEGCYVTDDKGREYIDGLAGLFTNQVGNGRGELGEVAARQMKELAFFPNWGFQHPRSLELAAKLAKIAPGDLDSTFFVSSGSEAVETVIKLARQYHKANGEPERYKIISRRVAYHGTTLGALSATGLPEFKAPFEPLPRGFYHVANTQQDPEGAADAIEEAIEAGPPETVAAVILEPVQNAGGCLVPPPDYWKRVREICDRHGVLLCSDAVICAFGRLGGWMGIERFGVVPDMTSFAKGVTSGYSPMGGVMVREQVHRTLAENVSMFAHGSTFGGHPVSSAVALENIRIIEREKLLENVRALEGHFGDELRRMAEGHPIVKEVRGMGFFWAVDLKPERADGTPLREDEYRRYFEGVLSRALLEGGLICRFEDKEDPVIQYSPALVADRALLSRIAEITDSALTELERELGYRSQRREVVPAAVADRGRGSEHQRLADGEVSTNPVLDSNTFGMEVVLDLYDCDPETIRSKERLQEYARELCQVIEMTPYGAPFAERFGLNEAKTAGYSIVQLIETSSITGHFSEERNSAYINIFSCKEFDPKRAAEFSKDFFEADRVETTLHIRR